MAIKSTARYTSKVPVEGFVIDRISDFCKPDPMEAKASDSDAQKCVDGRKSLKEKRNIARS